MRRAEPFLQSPIHRIVRVAIASAAIGALFAPSRAHALEPGDSNRDLRISAADMPSLIRILGGQPGNDGADANRDGFVLDDDIGATAAQIFGRPVFEPTFTPTQARTATFTTTRTPTRTPTLAMSTATGTATRSATPGGAATSTPTRTPTTIGPAASPTSTRVATFTSSPGATPTPTVTPTTSPTRTPTPTGPQPATSTPTVTRTFTSPGQNTATPTPTPTSPFPSTSTPTATRTPSATPTSTGTAGAIAVSRCSNTLPSPLPIPDNEPAGVSNSFVVPDNVPLEDLDVQVMIEHTYVSDLFVSLTHVDTGTNVFLVNGASALECPEDNVNCTFDDEAARFADGVCSMHDPAFGGGLVPVGFLGDLLGESFAGTWRLEIADEAAMDVGALVSWCLHANSTAPVVTSITCNDDFDCAVGPEEPFTIAFSFTDRDANASAYRLTAMDDLGRSFVLDEDVISPPSGDDTVVVSFQPFTCDDPPCDEIVFEFFATVIDDDGQESAFASILVTSLGTALRQSTFKMWVPHFQPSPAENAGEGAMAQASGAPVPLPHSAGGQVRVP